jgi:hypothetical protein
MHLSFGFWWTGVCREGSGSIKGAPMLYQGWWQAHRVILFVPAEQKTLL